MVGSTDSPVTSGKNFVPKVYNMAEMLEMQNPTEVAGNYLSIFGNLALVSALFLALTFRSPSMLEFVDGTPNLWGDQTTIAANIADGLLALSTLANIACVYECLSILCRFSEIPAVYAKIYVEEVGFNYLLRPYKLNDVGFISFVAGAAFYYSIILHYISGYLCFGIAAAILANHYIGFFVVSCPARERLFKILRQSNEVNKGLRYAIKEIMPHIEVVIDTMESKGITLCILRDSKLSPEEVADICDIQLTKVLEVKNELHRMQISDT